MDSIQLSSFEPLRALALLTLVVAMITSAVLIALLRPWLRRHALARPNARSSHKVPTPQGGGIAVIAATLLCGGAVVFVLHRLGATDQLRFAPVFLGVAALAVMGAIDDLSALGLLPRLLVQACAVVLVMATLPGELRLFPLLPLWLERAFLVLAGVWFVNAVNFMDGLDWMTVAETVPATAGVALVGALGSTLAPAEIGIALALCGAMLGFAPFNRPVAKLFLGDGGSLPVGLLLGWLLLLIAARGQLAAALLLPLYYLADSGVTLVRRLARGERIWEAHRTHFYQRATDSGFTVPQVIGRVFALNLVLAALAVGSLWVQGALAKGGFFALGAVLVAAVLWRFARGPARAPA